MMKLEVKKKIDPCIRLSAEGNRYADLVKDEMQGKIIDELWKMVEQYIKVEENYHEIKMSLNVNTLVEKAVDWNNGVPHMYDKQYLKIG